MCNKCSKRGHYARECWSKSVEGNAATLVEPKSRSKKEWDFQASYAVEESSSKCELDVEEQSFDMMVVSTCNTEPIEIAFATTNDKMINYKDDWIIDSGCSNHMTRDKEKFVSMSEYKHGRVVITANNLELPIIHIGKVVVTP